MELRNILIYKYHQLVQELLLKPAVSNRLFGDKYFGFIFTTNEGYQIIQTCLNRIIIDVNIL